jgi:hypothetical protein
MVKGGQVPKRNHLAEHRENLMQGGFPSCFGNIGSLSGAAAGSSAQQRWAGAGARVCVICRYNGVTGRVGANVCTSHMHAPGRVGSSDPLALSVRIADSGILSPQIDMKMLWSWCHRQTSTGSLTVHRCMLGPAATIASGKSGARSSSLRIRLRTQAVRFELHIYHVPAADEQTASCNSTGRRAYAG